MLIRKIETSDIKIVGQLVKEAYSQSPWFKKFSIEESESWISSDLRRSDFVGFIIVQSEIVVAASWYIVLSENEILNQSKGNDVLKFINSIGVKSIFWGRSLIVHPQFQKKGIGQILRKHIFKQLKQFPQNYFFTIMRLDNDASINGANKLKYKRTNIVFETNKIAYEYWYYNLKNNKQHN